MDDLLGEFLAETADSLEIVDAQLVRFESQPSDVETLNHIFRLIHTIKGTCGFLGLSKLGDLAHAGETLLGQFRDGAPTPTPETVSLILECVDHIRVLLARLEADGVEPDNDDDAELIARLRDASEMSKTDKATPADIEALIDAMKPVPCAQEDKSAEDSSSSESVAVAVAEASEGSMPVQGIAGQTLRVRVNVLEDLMTMVSELVLTRNQLMQVGRLAGESEFTAPIQKLSAVTAELQETVMKTRMQPIGAAWKKLPRLVRDTSREVGKSIKLVTEGETTELDRQVLDQICDPLTHMVRNACDHGIEDAETRAALGKPRFGTVRISAYHEGGHILIELSDDGSGLDAARIRASAVEKGLIDANATLSDAQILRLIFEPGFSTAKEVTNVSGRGVGMDVVRTNIEVIGGSVDVASELGQGSVFTIKIPLTLAIISVLIIGVDGQKLALPQLAILELVKLGSAHEHDVERIDDTPVLRLRDQLLPLVYLADLLSLNSDLESLDAKARFIIVMQVGGSRFGLVVDEVLDTEEIVVKPLARLLGSRPEYSGATLLGDGAIILILDPSGLARAVRSLGIGGQARIAHESGAADDQNMDTVLVFRSGQGAPKACHLNLVSRLEVLDVSSFEASGTGTSVQYRGVLMPLIGLHGRDSMANSGSMPVIVFGHGEKRVGLVVAEIVDIVEQSIAVEIGSKCEGFLGTAVIKGQATEIIDVGHYLNQARPGWNLEDAGDDCNKRILLVESHPFFRNLLNPILTAAGYHVATAEGEIEARSLIESGNRPFDAILADVDHSVDASGLEEITRHSGAVTLALSSRESPSAIAKSDRQTLLRKLEDAIRNRNEAA